MSVTVVTQIQRVVVRGSGASYSDARVLAYLRTILTTNGDLLTVASNTLARIGLGSSGQVLTVSGGAAVWAAPTGFANPMSAQGDLIIGGVSGAPTRLARGTNGQILSVSGSTLAWIDAPTSYTDADAIAAIAGEVTDHQLIQRQNGTGLQGISLSTIYDGAIDAIEAMWLPRLEEFRPQMLFISAGFDAHREDDLGQLGLVEADYAWITQRLVDLAERHCKGRIVSCLEGGYVLSSLARSVAAHLRVLAGV